MVVGAGIVWLITWVLKHPTPISIRIKHAMHQRSVEKTREGKSSWFKFDVLPIALSAWTILVLIFLFIPIMLVVLHSFNGGSSFTIWSGNPGTKWWDELFDGSVAWAVLARFAALFVISVVARNVLMRTTKISRRLLNWSGPIAFLLAFVINGMSTNWYETVFGFASIGDAIRNSFIAAFGATILAVIRLRVAQVCGPKFLWQPYFLFW
jgi:ABC-type Fe3+ transport system permease subunit